MTYFVLLLLFFVLLVPAGVYLFLTHGRKSRELQGLADTGQYGASLSRKKKEASFFRLTGLGLLAAFAFLVLLTTFVSMFYTIETKQVGVIKTFSAISGTQKDDGPHIKAPWQSVEKYSTALKKREFEIAASASDNQEIIFQTAVNYSVDPAKVETLARTVGPDWEDVLIPDRVQQLVKNAVVKYPTTQVAVERQVLAVAATDSLREALGEFGIRVEAVLFSNIVLPKPLTDAITAKQVADQKALEAANVTKQREEEAKQAIATAKGQAESNRILAQSLQTSPELLEVRLAEIAANAQVAAIEALAASSNLQLVPADLLLTRPVDKE